MHKISLNVVPAQCGKMSYSNAIEWEREDYRVEQKMDGSRCFFAVQERGIVEARLWSRGRFRSMPKGQKPLPWHPHLAGSVFDGVFSTNRYYVIFDCLCYRGQDIRELPLRQRRAALCSLADFFPAGTYIIPQRRKASPLMVTAMVWKDIEAPYSKSNWFVAEYGKSW